jgi:hypothetical protein
VGNLNRKVQIGIASVIAILAIGTTGYFKHEQAQIDQKTVSAKSLLAQKEKQIDMLSNAKHTQKIQNDPIAKSNEQETKTVELMQNNGQALFKLLDTIKENETQTELNIRNQNSTRYATQQALSDTGLNTKDVKDINRFKENIEHINTDLYVNSANEQGIYEGVISENTIISSINFVGKRNQTTWYLFKYDSKSKKFINFTLLGFNFKHEN